MSRGSTRSDRAGSRGAIGIISRKLFAAGRLRCVSARGAEHTGSVDKQRVEVEIAQFGQVHGASTTSIRATAR